MLAISTVTSPLGSCQICAVPIVAPLTSYMMAVAAETELRIRCAVEHAPQSATVTAALNIRELLGSFIFDSGWGNLDEAAQVSFPPVEFRAAKPCQLRMWFFVQRTIVVQSCIDLAYWAGVLAP